MFDESSESCSALESRLLALASRGNFLGWMSAGRWPRLESAFDIHWPSPQGNGILL